MTAIMGVWQHEKAARTHETPQTPKQSFTEDDMLQIVNRVALKLQFLLVDKEL
jgi:hypothetical protein